MTTTSSINGPTNQPSASSSSAIPLNMQINQTDFLKLITAQLTDQNPLSPADPTQFVSQLEGMSEVSSMQSMQSSMQAAAIMNGTTLIGRSVLAPGTQATLAAGGSISGAATAPAGASSLTVSVTDANGNPMTSFSVAPSSSGGLTPFTWNGVMGSGGAAPPGTYTIGVSATVNGTTQPVNPNLFNKVDSVLVDPTSQAVDVTTDSGSVPLTSVISVM